MNISLLGIDIAKNVFHLYGVDSLGRELYRKKVYRSDLLSLIGGLQTTKIAVEACGGSNFWCREFEKLGHRAQLIAPQYVKPFVKRNKTDWKDAEAITVAVRQPSIPEVPKKSEEQQDIQNLHRIRERLVKARTALVNEVRGLMLEYGISIPVGRHVFSKKFIEILGENESRLSSLTRETFYDLWQEYLAVDERVVSYEKKLKAICKAHPICTRLLQVPGIGYLTATAIVAAVSDISVFKNGRQLAAWLGLTPRERTTGGKQRLGGISKRGDKYLRKLLVHGARVVLRYARKKGDRLSRWVTDLEKQKGTNKSAVALANKNARVIWAMLSKDEDYQEFQLAA